MMHLREWPRYQIAAKLEAGCTKKEIAAYLHVHPSTITREIQRNGYSRYRCYRPRIAQERASHRWRCRHLPRRFKEDVRKKVDEMILMDYSPDQIIGILECLKQYDLVKTITADNGLQFAEHERVSRATSVGFFFARPYHSWERGANENTNGLIRQYIPKGSDFTNITQEFLEEVERKLNERPRKRHGFLSPNQVFSKSTVLDARVFV
ncbi:MAG: IS30 family transposase [Bacteroidales bacterium]|nr:IS30 family transposase [Bacteroidales bacterium]